MDLKYLSLAELSELIQTEKITPKEIYTYFLERVKKYNGELDAFITLPSELQDTEFNADLIENIQYQLPIAVKDIFCEV